jgi:pimeloyl-ACP methyl ester carboxylesterase
MALPAPYFARRGIAVLALDKRSDWQGATFENIADDVVAAVQMLRRRNDIGRIGLYASSQGGWVAPIAAARSADISFVVCAACPATPMPQQELIRTEYELRADGFSADQIGQALAYRRQLFGYIHDGSGLPLLEQLDTAAKRSKWYARFGGVPSREAPVAQWWRINDRSDPAVAWRRVRVPVLLLFGERDTRVPPAEHAKLIAKALGMWDGLHPVQGGLKPASTFRHSKIVIVPRIDHEGFVARTGGGDEVLRLDRLPPRAVEPAIDWIVALP